MKRRPLVTAAAWLYPRFVVVRNPDGNLRPHADISERAIAMNESELKELIMRKQVDGKISCKVVFDIAEEAGASKREVGELLNEMQIKIQACQLGCFK